MSSRHPTSWQLTAWVWSVRYWSVVCLSSILLPLWVLYINREGEFTNGDQLGLLASLFPAAMGLILAFSLHRLAKMERAKPGSGADIGEHLGVGLVVLSLMAMVLSLLTLNAIGFLAFILVLLLPAGVLAGTSAELSKAV